MNETENETTSEREEKVPTVYEIAYHLSHAIPADGALAFSSELRGMFEREGGVIIKEETPKARTLLYPFRRKIGNEWHTFTSAQFGWIKFECESAAATALKAMLDSDARVLRYLLVATSREDTMHHPRYSFGRPERIFLKKPMKEEHKVPLQTKPISEAEIDKEIEALVAE